MMLFDRKVGTTHKGVLIKLSNDSEPHVRITHLIGAAHTWVPQVEVRLFTLNKQQMAHVSIEEFVCSYFNLPQTALVDGLLYADKHMEMVNSLYNLHLHTVKLSTGIFIGTHNQLTERKAVILDQLQHRRNTALQKDVERLECDVGKERTVYEWYAVPYWIARYMIDANEVVLSWQDCYWWGRCVIGQSLTMNTAIVSLFSRLE